MGPIVNHSRKRSAQETDVHTTEETPNHRLRQSTWAFIHKNEPNQTKGHPRQKENSTVEDSDNDDQIKQLT